MTEVHMVETSSKRSRTFWSGFGIGVLFMLIAVAIFWFLGLLDLFPQDGEETSNDVVANEELNNDADADAINNEDVDNDSDDKNNTQNNDVENDEDSSGTSSTVTGEGVTLTLSRDVDDSANAVDPTEIFGKDDERIYVVVEFDDPAALDDPTVTVEWYKDGTKTSDFDYDLPEGQSRIYFYQTNAGAGDYEVAIKADGKELARSEFVVE